jgi:hypothetical protein
VGIIEILLPGNGVPHGSIIWPALQKNDEVI